MNEKRQVILPYERPIIRDERTLYKKKRIKKIKTIRPKKEKKTKYQDNPFKAYIHAERIKRLRPVLAVVALVAVWYILVGRQIVPEFVDNLPIGKEKREAGPIYYEVGCSEANLARMLVLSCGESLSDEKNEEKEAAGNELENEGLWYEPYYEGLDKLHVTALKKENAFKLLNYWELKESFKACFGEHITDLVVEEKEHYQLYEVTNYLNEALEKSGKGKIAFIETGILATPADDVPLNAWEILTSDGKKQFEGLVLAPLKNQTVCLAMVGEQIIGITEIKSNRCEIRRCKMLQIEDKKAATYEVEGMTFTYEQTVLIKEQEGELLDLTLEDGKIVDFKAASYEAVDTVLKVSDTTITLEKAGKLAYESVAVSDATDLNRYHCVGDLVYGVKVAYVTQEEKLTALQVIGPSGKQAIRVVLSDSRGQYIENEVRLVSSSDYDLVYGGKASDLSKGQEWQSEKFEWSKENDTVRFVPREESTLTLLSVEKGGQSPSYKGIIEVTKEENGYVIVNEVDLEEYVAGVLLSEMPADYGIEALKAQAVAARTYGVNALNGNRFMAYGANVDDTTACQVYNRVSPNEAAYEAVTATAGLVLKSEGKLISDKFFATSCGYTANAGEVWADSHFPGNTPSYLCAEKQYTDGFSIEDLSNEQDFASFIKRKADEIDAFDEESPWFRWQVHLEKEQLENLLIPAINTFVENNSPYISFEDHEGNAAEAEENLIKTIKEIEVRQRGEGGNIMRLAVKGEEFTAIIETEYAIRKLFASNDKEKLEVIRQDNSVQEGMNLLPSAFFTIETNGENGEVKEIQLYGGGMGHGVGLSQDGAKRLAALGNDYKAILNHYFRKSNVVNIWEEQA